MSIHHHPEADLLAAYAAGSLTEGPAILVATHLALCPACRGTVSSLEELGGTLIEEAPPAALADDALDRLLVRLDEIPPAAPAAAPPPTEPKAEGLALLMPQPLRGYLAGGLDDLKWRAFGRNYREHEVFRDSHGHVVQLLDIAPEAAMPHHGHGGEELTMVLQGGFTDENGHYLRGDVATMDESGEHQPVADPGEHCLCIAVSTAPVRLTGVLGRLLQPFLRL